MSAYPASVVVIFVCGMLLLTGMIGMTGVGTASTIDSGAPAIDDALESTDEVVDETLDSSEETLEETTDSDDDAVDDTTEETADAIDDTVDDTTEDTTDTKEDTVDDTTDDTADAIEATVDDTTEDTTDAIEDTVNETADPIENTTNETDEYANGTLENGVETVDSANHHTNTAVESVSELKDEPLTTNVTTVQEDADDELVDTWFTHTMDDIETTTLETTAVLETATGESIVLLEQTIDGTTDLIERTLPSTVTIVYESSLSQSDSERTVPTSNSTESDDALKLASKTPTVAERNNSTGFDASDNSTVVHEPTSSPPTNGEAASNTVIFVVGIVANATAAGGVAGVISVHSPLSSNQRRRLTRPSTALERQPWELFASVFRYSRYDDSDPLEHERRRTIYDVIEATPGIYLSEIETQTGIPLSSVRHHLRILDDEGLITSSSNGSKRRYFTNDIRDERSLILQMSGAKRTIIDVLDENGNLTNTELASKLDLDPSTISHHVRALEARDLLVRERDGRTIRNELSSRTERSLADR